MRVTNRLSRLPRPCDPRNPLAGRIWHPATLHKVDSAALRDFGFPSTHSMNAVTNPGYLLMYDGWSLIALPRPVWAFLCVRLLAPTTPVVCRFHPCLFVCLFGFLLHSTR